MKKKNDRLKETIREVLAGIIFCGIVELLICLFFVGGGPLCISMVKIRSMAVVVLGCLFAVGWFFHMERSLKEAVAMGEKGASFHTRKGYAFRMVIAAAFFIVVAFTKVIPFLAVLAGVLTLKPAVYLQPLFHRCLLKFGGKEEMG